MAKLKRHLWILYKRNQLNFYPCMLFYGFQTEPGKLLGIYWVKNIKRRGCVVFVSGNIIMRDKWTNWQ